MASKGRILELFDIDVDKGFLIRKRGRGKGKRAGYTNSNGYRVICIDREDYFEHNIIWFLFTGTWPTRFIEEIDHINRIRDDNRWRNLRLATRSQNLVNRNLSSRNKTGVLGVSFDKKRNKFVVQLSINKTIKHVGRFDSLEEAAKVSKEARQAAFGEFSN